AGNRKTWTFSFWVKRTDPSVNSTLFSAAHSNTSNPFSLIQLKSSGAFRFSDYSNSTTTQAAKNTTRLLRDTASWYHIVLSVDTTQASASNRIKIYINGSEETSFSSSTDYAQDYESVINDAYSQAFGWYMPYNSTYYNDYLAEVHFIDGQALTPASFGETNSATNQWVPIDAKDDLTYGTNGFYLPFSSTELATSFTDSSSSSHTITANGDVTNTRAQNKVGSSSIKFDGTADYLSVADSTDWTLGSNFTVETWVRFNSIAGHTLLNQWKGGGILGAWTIQFEPSGGGPHALKFYYSTNGTNMLNSSWSWTPSTNTWYHVAVVRDGSDLELYIDGTQTGSTYDISSSTIANIAWPLEIGY
ncbi:MAG: hypothetical protein QF535_08815, partial [Anaerolineales bacterium]|nr:hypothetical protein [Anaerolineales bacterium]